MSSLRRRTALPVLPWLAFLWMAAAQAQQPPADAAAPEDPPATQQAAGARLAALPTARLLPPQATNPALAENEPPHLVATGNAPETAPLLVWLPGTNGHPETGPRRLFETVLAQGYRLVGLSYRTAPAVSQVCVRAALQRQPECPAQMRQHRVWGQPLSPWIDDQPRDAIVPRLTRLLQHLAASEPQAGWQAYLEGAGSPQGERPRWSRIVLAGQSQGGGMAATIAKTEAVAGVILFSGGWDQQPGGDIARWYARPSATPPQRWHATFHVDEPQAGAMAKIARTLGLPPEHIHALAEPVQGRQAHGEGIGNPVYRPLWERMLQQLR